jgi:hypothetical protein
VLQSRPEGWPAVRLHSCIVSLLWLVQPATCGINAADTALPCRCSSAFISCMAVCSLCWKFISALLLRSFKDPDRCKHSTCSYSLGYVIRALCSLLTHDCTAFCFCCCSSGMQPMCIYRVTAVNPIVVQTGTFESTRCVNTGALRSVLCARADIWGESARSLRCTPNRTALMWPCMFCCTATPYLA